MNDSIKRLSNQKADKNQMKTYYMFWRKFFLPIIGDSFQSILFYIIFDKK